MVNRGIAGLFLPIDRHSRIRPVQLSGASAASLIGIKLTDGSGRIGVDLPNMI